MKFYIFLEFKSVPGTGFDICPILVIAINELIG